MRVRSALLPVVLAVGLASLSVVSSHSVFRSPTAGAANTPHVDAVPEGVAGNANRDIPAANIWLCVSGPCSGPGEGDLKVLERATNVQTTSGRGLGAYDFTIGFDASVIASVNPVDVAFSTGSGNSFGGSPMSLGLGYRLGRTAAACAVSPISESRIRFACVTSGPGADVAGGHDGPSGNFALALLDLVPLPTLTNRIYPSAGNGATTVIAQSCGLLDVYGSPVDGALHGGAVVACGDVATTVRILEGDLNLDCKVDVIDETLIAYRRGAVFPSPWYNRWFDLEPAARDRDIDIKDVQQVFGREGSTCQSPIPQQTPVAPPYPING